MTTAASRVFPSETLSLLSILLDRSLLRYNLPSTDWHLFEQPLQIQELLQEIEEDVSDYAFNEPGKMLDELHQALIASKLLQQEDTRSSCFIFPRLVFTDRCHRALVGRSYTSGILDRDYCHTLSDYFTRFATRSFADVALHVAVVISGDTDLTHVNIVFGPPLPSVKENPTCGTLFEKCVTEEEIRGGGGCFAAREKKNDEHDEKEGSERTLPRREEEERGTKKQKSENMVSKVADNTYPISTAKTSDDAADSSFLSKDAVCNVREKKVHSPTHGHNGAACKFDSHPTWTCLSATGSCNRRYLPYTDQTARQQGFPVLQHVGTGLLGVAPLENLQTFLEREHISLKVCCHYAIYLCFKLLVDPKVLLAPSSLECLRHVQSIHSHFKGLLAAAVVKEKNMRRYFGWMGAAAVGRRVLLRKNARAETWLFGEVDSWDEKRDTHHIRIISPVDHAGTPGARAMKDSEVAGTHRVQAGVTLHGSSTLRPIGPRLLHVKLWDPGLQVHFLGTDGESEVANSRVIRRFLDGRRRVRRDFDAENDFWDCLSYLEQGQRLDSICRN